MRFIEELISMFSTFSRRWLARNAFTFPLFVLLGLAIYTQTAPFLTETVRQNRDWSFSAQKEIGGEAAKTLFEAALHFGIISFDLPNQHFSILTPREWDHQDSIIEPVKRRAIEKSLRSVPYFGMSAKNALLRLWKSNGPGRDIRLQLEGYNAQSGFVAIRDNSGQLKSCPDETDSQAPCKASIWQGAVVQRAELTRRIQETVTAHTSRSGHHIEKLMTNAPPVTIFGQFAVDLIPNFRDWMTLKGEELAGQRVRFTRPMPTDAQKGPLIIDLIGKNPDLPADIRSASTFRYFCPPEEKSSQTLVDCKAQDKAVAIRITIPQEAANRLNTIALAPIGMDRVPLVERSAKLDLERADPARILSRSATYPLTNNIRLQCFNDAQSLRNCQLKWLASSSKLYLIEVGGQDELAQMIALTKTQQPTESDTKAENLPPYAIIDVTTRGHMRLNQRGTQLGLANILGQDSRHTQTYLSYLTAPDEGVSPADLTLQINPIAQDIISNRFDELVVQKKKIAGILPNLPDRFDPYRRASVVLLDLQDPDNMGAIMAATAFPAYQGGLSSWDIRAIKTVASHRYPLANHVWHSLDSRFTPGSAFKIVSALSFIDYATQRTGPINTANQNNVGQAVKGMDRTTFQSVFDTDLRASRKIIQKSPRQRDGQFEFGDAGQTIPMHYATRLPRNSCGRNVANRVTESKTVYVRTYGLCEALAQSSNIWFASVGLLANEDIRDAFYAGSAVEESLPLQNRTLSYLWPYEAIPLIRTASIQANNAATLPVAQVVTESGQLARSQQPHKSMLELSLAINQYGQAVQISPLAMASLTATVATNRIVHPFLAKQKDLSVRTSELYPTGSEAYSLLGILREGMHGAVNWPSGTAQRVFHGQDSVARDLASRVYGKTGTATLAGHGIGGKEKIYGGWFVGWINGTGAGKDEPKYAFACALSHIANGGGRECAALMSQILADLEEAGL